MSSLTSKVVNRTLERLSICSPFVLRSVTPPIQSVVGQEIRGIRRVGKRIVLTFESDLFLVIPPDGRRQAALRERGRKLGLGSKIVLASFEFAQHSVADRSRLEKACVDAARAGRGRAER
jgi:formamidopyrimidine-DNA glycosylase